MKCNYNRRNQGCKQRDALWIIILEVLDLQRVGIITSIAKIYNSEIKQLLKLTNRA